MPSQHQISLAPLSRRHFDSVVRIEKAGVPPFWRKTDFYHAVKNKNSHAYVLEVGPEYKVVGFVACEAKTDAIEIINISVDPQERRKGYGVTLIAGLRVRFPGRKIWTLAFEHNVPYQLFLSKGAGFRCETTIKGEEFDCYPFELPEETSGQDLLGRSKIPPAGS